MASKTSFLAFICLLPLPYLSISVLAHPSGQNHSTFNFIKTLAGSKKGDKVEGIHKLKKYLHHFGYLDHTHLNVSSNRDHFDENLESAIKIYQINFNLKPTGILDTETMLQMSKPRCGVADIVNGRTRMNAGKYTSKYAYFPGSPKWPLTKKQLTWAIEPGTRRDVVAPMGEFAFPLWSTVTPFQYVFGDENIDATDIKIYFRNRDSDGYLDGPGGILAYAYAPTDGRMVFDSDENWSDGPVNDAFDMGTVGLHELGHILGLAHSSDEEAVMFPTGPIERSKGLSDDDKQGMLALYAN